MPGYKAIGLPRWSRSGRFVSLLQRLTSHFPFDDPHDPERWDPRLTLPEEILLTRAPEVAELPLGIRLVTRLAASSRALSRRGTTILRYRF